MSEKLLNKAMWSPRKGPKPWLSALRWVFVVNTYHGGFVNKENDCNKDKYKDIFPNHLQSHAALLPEKHWYIWALMGRESQGTGGFWSCLALASILANLYPSSLNHGAEEWDFDQQLQNSLVCPHIHSTSNEWLLGNSPVLRSFW